jgi:hypothetical protein
VRSHLFPAQQRRTRTGWYGTERKQCCACTESSVRGTVRAACSRHVAPQGAWRGQRAAEVARGKTEPSAAGVCVTTMLQFLVCWMFLGSMDECYLSCDTLVVCAAMHLPARRGTAGWRWPALHCFPGWCDGQGQVLRDSTSCKPMPLTLQQAVPHGSGGTAGHTFPLVPSLLSGRGVGGYPAGQTAGTRAPGHQVPPGAAPGQFADGQRTILALQTQGTCRPRHFVSSDLVGSAPGEAHSAQVQPLACMYSCGAAAGRAPRVMTATTRHRPACTRAAADQARASTTWRPGPLMRPPVRVMQVTRAFFVRTQQQQCPEPSLLR